MTYEFLLPREIGQKTLTFTVDGIEHVYPVEDVVRSRYESFVMSYSRMSDAKQLEAIERSKMRAEREESAKAYRIQRALERRYRDMNRERLRYGKPRGFSWVQFEPSRGTTLVYGKPPTSVEPGGIGLDPRISYMPEVRMVDARRILNKARRFALRENLPENYAAYVTFKSEESSIIKAFLYVWPKDGEVITAPTYHIESQFNASEVARSSHAAAPGVRPRNTPSEALLAEAEAAAERKEAQEVTQLAEQPPAPAEQPEQPKQFTDDQGRIQAPHVDPHSTEYRAKKAKKAEWVRQMVALTPEERNQHADVAGAFDAHHEFLMTYTHNFVGDESMLAQRVKEIHGLKPGDVNYNYYRDIERKNAQSYAEMDYFYGLLELEDDLERHQLLAQGRTPLVMPKDVQREKNIRLHGGNGNVDIPFSL